LTGPLSSKSKTAREIDDEHRAWALANPAIGGCLFCPKFKPRGTGAEVKELNLRHLEEKHPELVKLRRRRRPRRTGIIAFRQSLTEDESAEIDENRAKRMKLLGID